MESLRRIGQEARQIRRKAGDFLAERSVDSLLNDLKPYGESAVDHVDTEFFGRYNVEPQYEFNPEDRQKLRQEKGLVIGNHPGILDIPIILKALKSQDGKVRRDFKVFITQYGNAAKLLADSIGEQYVIPVIKDYEGASAALEGAARYIEENNGLFIIFPTGGMDQIKPNIKFQKGIVHLMDRLSPDTMVYNFFIDPVKFAEMNSRKRRVAASLKQVSGFPNFNRMRGKENIKVKETYTQAGEWQKLISHKNGRPLYAESAEALTSHFLEIYPELK